MTVSDIIKRINNLVGNGNYLYKDLINYMDECVDQINVEIAIQLPLFSEVYANTFIKNDAEATLVFETNSLANQYKRIPDEYIRNYICYEVAYRKLRDEDEAEEVYGSKMAHAYVWFEKLRSRFSYFTTDVSDAVTVNGDVRTSDTLSDEELLVTPGLF